MTDVTYSPALMMHTLIFTVACHSIHSRGDQRRFFAQMRRALAARGYAMSQWQGFCVVVPLHEQDPREGRYDVLNWLVDQLETAKVTVHDPMPINELLTGRFIVLDAREQMLDPRLHTVARELVRHIAAGAAVHALRRLQWPRSREPSSRQTNSLP